MITLAREDSPSTSRTRCGIRNCPHLLRNLPSWGSWALLSLILAGAASAQIFYSNLWYDLFRPRMWLIDLVEDLLLPLWIAFTTMAFIRFPVPRKRLWWLLLPAPLCFLR